MKKIILLASVALASTLSACGDSQGGNIEANQGDIDAAAIVDPSAVTKAELQSAVSDERVRDFYEARDWQPVWTQDNAVAAVKMLRAAGNHGLDPRDYIAAVETDNDPSAREAALTTAALDLADALADGKSDPAELYEVYTFPRPDVDIAAGLEQAVTQNNVGEWLASLAPQDDEYRALSETYVKFAEQARTAKESQIDGGDVVQVGDRDPRVPQIAAILERNGYLKTESAAQPASQREDSSASTNSTAQTDADNATVFTERMSEALKAMQRDFGIEDDGIIGESAIEMLNTGAAERARILAINLDRRRWYARNSAPTRIDVNIATATLDYIRDGKLRDSRKVIVGQSDWETPQLASPMFRLVANPTWTVPKSIEEEELTGKGASYFQANNMVRRDGYIVQLPGPDNALGEVKFDLKNDHAIYLHDTAADSLFGRDERYLSHGCVRVEDALGFARMIAQDAGVSNRYRQAAASGEETFVDLPKEIPVRLLYHTAFIDDAGKVAFRNDPYGWDEKVAGALGYEMRQPIAVDGHIRDVGP